MRLLIIGVNFLINNVIKRRKNVHFHSMNTTASALTAQRLRMDVISSNIANVDTTRAKQVNGEWEPYRKIITLKEQEGQFSSFKYCDG